MDPHVAPFALLCLLQAPAPPRPAWVESLPEAPGRIYALGTAELGDQEGRAIAQASDRARFNVVARLGATVRGETRVATRLVEPRGAGASGRQVWEDVQVGAAAVDLPGLGVARTFTDRAARTVFALAYLDLDQARRALAVRLDRLREARLRLGPEVSRRALWRTRQAASDLDRLALDAERLEAGPDLLAAMRAEQAVVAARLEELGRAPLPPLDLAKLTLALRTNAELPPGVEAYLRALAASCGPTPRDAAPDLVLDLAFSGGAAGPAFIFASPDGARGATYHLEARATLLDGGGAAVTRPVPIVLVQGETPEGLVQRFRHQMDRWLPRLLDEAKAAWRRGGCYSRTTQTRRLSLTPCTRLIMASESCLPLEEPSARSTTMTTSSLPAGRLTLRGNSRSTFADSGCEGGSGILKPVPASRASVLVRNREASATMAEPEGLILSRSQKEMEAWSTRRASAISSWDHRQVSRTALIRSPRVAVESGASELESNRFNLDAPGFMTA
nr:hypothetical protein [Mesoterricola sediminis]